jgi:cytochrome P450
MYWCGRWGSPARHFLRTAAEPCKLSGQRFEAGDTVFLSYPSANRDEEVFTDPFRFDIGRSPNPHVAFGSGPHFCLGSHLAKLEVKAVFAELAKRVRSFEITGEPRQVASIAAGGLSHLPMRCDFL